MVNYKHTEERKRKMRELKLGTKNPNYKNGLYAEKSLSSTCEICGDTDKLDVHHKDGDRTHNQLTNLIVLCRRHHMFMDGRLRIGETGEVLERWMNQKVRTKISVKAKDYWKLNYAKNFG